MVDRARYQLGDESLQRETEILKMVGRPLWWCPCMWRCGHDTAPVVNLGALQVHHPNCITLHAVFETDKRVFIVTELVSGGELLDR